MKKILAAVLTAAVVVSLAGCGSSTTTKNPAYLSGITASDYVELPDYSKIEITAEKPEVTEDYVNEYIQYMMSMNASTEEITDRDVVQEGDIANIDFVGYKDGTAFDGGSGEGYDLEIGSGNFIPGFEDGLVGAKVGETVSLNLTFPEDYQSEELAGQDVVFDVTVNSIKQSVEPELNDEYVAGLGIEDVATVDDYKAYMTEQLEAQAEESYESEVQGDILQWMEDNSEFKQDIPTEMIDRWNETYTNMFTQYATQYGVDLKTFMTTYGSSEDTYEEDIRNMAEDMAKRYVIMQAVADKEGLKVDDKEFNEAVTNAAAQYGYSSASEFKESEDMDEYRDYLVVQKAVDLLKNNVVVTE